MLENVEELNFASKAKMIEEMIKLQINGEIETAGGDQSSVKGNEGQVLRMMWANGANYNPLCNPVMSSWAKDCYEGKLNEVKEHLAENPNLLEQRESTLRMAGLHHVIAGARTINPIPSNAKAFPEKVRVKVTDSTDHIGCIKYLIEQGARVEAKDVAGHTPLHHCTTLVGNNLTLKIAKVLIEVGGADVNSINRFGETPLVAPVRDGRSDYVEMLIENGAQMNITENDGVNLLQLAHCLPFPTKISEMMSKAGASHAKFEQKVAKADGLYKSCAICKNTDATKRCTGCYMKWY